MVNDMKFREFVDWCNQRACDGCWSMQTAVFCIDVVQQVRKQPFWKREKKWQELNADGYIEKAVIFPIEEKIAEVFGRERQWMN